MQMIDTGLTPAQMNENIPESRPKISLVVNYYNPKAVARVDTITTLCLETLKDYTQSTLEVILSNGGGVDSPVIMNLCQRLGFRYTVSPIPQNFEAIYNHGLELATGELVGILENDIFMSEGWDQAMISEMQRTGAHLALPYLSSCDNIIQQTGFPFQHITFEPSGISHNMFLFDREAFKVMYPFDTQFNGTQNDDDLYMRLKAAGLRMIVCKGAFAIHYRRATAGYSPWTFTEDEIKFRAKYPQLKYGAAWGHYQRGTPWFSKSPVYRMLINMTENWPLKRARPYLARQVRRLEPIFHRI